MNTDQQTKAQSAHSNKYAIRLMKLEFRKESQNTLSTDITPKRVSKPLKNQFKISSFGNACSQVKEQFEMTSRTACQTGSKTSRVRRIINRSPSHSGSPCLQINKSFKRFK